jgi:AraC family transcriptional regulator
MQNETLTYYKQKVSEVLIYIDNHLSDELNVKQLSELFGISFYHFHRILKAYLNEPLGSYINRQRLETAIKLIRYSDESLTDIAIKIGYNDCSAFSKAFSKEFGISPQEFKTNRAVILNTHIDYKINDSGNIIADIKPKIIQLADKYVVYTRFTGEYGCSAFSSTWEDFLGFAIQNKLLGWNPDIFSIYHDLPSEVGIDNCVTDFCIATSKQFVPVGNMSCKWITGGKYAVFRYKGSYELLWELYETIYRVLVINTNLKLRDLPVIEKYLHYTSKNDPQNFLTEIYIPIE